MKAPRLYTDTPSMVVEQEVRLNRDASKYLTRVLRRKTGDNVILFNGDGYNYVADITDASSQTTARITSVQANDSESPFQITLVQSLAKGTKLDLVIQKATELGVQQVVPVIAERSVMQIDASRQQKKMEHWRAVAISACTQCGRSRLPQIEPPGALNDWLANRGKDSVLLHPSGHESITNVKMPTTGCTLIIGPEGGFSESEISKAKQSGVQIVTCGPRVLRTETAGFTAVSILQSRFGDL